MGLFVAPSLPNLYRAPKHILTLYSHSLEHEAPLLCLRPTPSGLPLLCLVTIWLQLWSLRLGVLQGGPGVGSCLQGPGR